MMFLVLSPQAHRHHKVFCGLGKPLPAPLGAPRKRAAAMPQPSLGRSVVVSCRPVCLVRDAYPLNCSRELSPRVIKSSRAKTTYLCKCSDSSRCRFSRAQRKRAWHSLFLPFFPDRRAMPGTTAASADCVGGWCPPCPRIAQPRDGTDPRRPDRLQPRAARSGPCRDNQLIPISTAIRIRSEWFLAPSFCLSRDVVLATVL